jgi:hypothetical protein
MVLKKASIWRFMTLFIRFLSVFFKNIGITLGFEKRALNGTLNVDALAQRKGKSLSKRQVQHLESFANAHTELRCTSIFADRFWGGKVNARRSPWINV